MTAPEKKVSDQPEPATLDELLVRLSEALLPPEGKRWAPAAAVALLAKRYPFWEERAAEPQVASLVFRLTPERRSVFLLAMLAGGAWTAAKQRVRQRLVESLILKIEGEWDLSAPPGLIDCDTEEDLIKRLGVALAVSSPAAEPAHESAHTRTALARDALAFLVVRRSAPAPFPLLLGLARFTGDIAADKEGDPGFDERRIALFLRHFSKAELAPDFMALAGVASSELAKVRAEDASRLAALERRLADVDDERDLALRRRSTAEVEAREATRGREEMAGRLREAEDNLSAAYLRYEKLGSASELEVAGTRARIAGEMQRLLRHELGEMKILFQDRAGDAEAKFVLTCIENIERGARRILGE